MLTESNIFQGVDDANDNCTRCGKHISELKPFDDSENEAALRIRFRILNYYETDEKCEEILKAIGVGGLDEAIASFGVEKVNEALGYDEGRGWIEESLECRDCINEPGEFFDY